MGKIVVIDSKGMNLWAKFALVTLSTLLVSAFMYESVLALNLPIMHNSSSTTSAGSQSKYGSWGLDKNCSWCHAENTTNVKLISQTIETPNGPRAVVFTRMTASSNDQPGVLGNDARTYAGNGASGSANICEVCHRRTLSLFHQYSSKASGHYDNQLCTGCHSHADGFKPNGHVVPFYAVQSFGHDATGLMTCSNCHANTGADLTYPTTGSAPDCRACHTKDDPAVGFNGCGSCHGEQGGNGEPSGTVHPDAAGSHAAHTIIGGVTCTTCHNPGGTGGNAAHGKGNRGANAALVNLTTSFGWNSGAATCSTVSCHANPYGANPVTTPAWGTDANCGACHKGTPGDFQVGNGAPATGSHDIHMAIPEIACNKCHVDAARDGSGGAHHLNGFINVTSGYPVTPKHAPGIYAGTCSTADCHANVYGPGYSVTPVWGADAKCGACHVAPGVFQLNGAPATGSHAKHLDAPVSAACGQCHDAAVKNSDGGAAHRNNSIDVTNDYTGSPVTKHAQGTYTGVCQNATCHANPYASNAIPSPVWGEAVGCAACHTGAGAFQNSTGHPRTGSHGKHMALNAAACNQCHAGAVKGENPGTRHLNAFVNVTGGYTTPSVSKHPIGTYNGTCANICHTNGNGTDLASPRWGVAMAANCSGCHGGDSKVTPVAAILATGKHRSHMNNISTLGKGNNLKCAECHAKTVSLASNTLVTNTVNHVNLLKDYSGAKAGGSDNYSVADKVCSNVYCHSTGQSVAVYVNMTGSKAWSGNAKFDCNGCHGSYPGAATYFGAPNYPNKYSGTLATANSHERHTVVAGDTNSTACAKCHVTSSDATVPNKLRNYSSTHLNMTRDVAYRYTFAGYSEVYHVNDKTCATYCHSNVQAPGITGGPATYYSKPAWGDNYTMSCSSCHRDLSILAENPTDLNFGSHRRHVAFTNLTSGNAGAGYACSLCHGAAYSATGAETPLHANGAINLPFTGKGSGTIYSQGAASAPGNGYGTCTSKCHGRATKNWGANTTVHVCEKCHGSANTAINQGQFKDTGGNPAGNYAGTHVSHLAGTHNLMAPIQCSECHVVPATFDSFDHMSSIPAKLTWGPLSTRNSVIRGYTSSVAIPMVPQYTYGLAGSAGTCNNNYCHSGVKYRNISTGVVTAQGKKPSPKWGDPGYLGGTGCDTCHGYPPSGTHPQSNSCSACHDHVSQSNLSMEDKTQHLNGVVNTTVDECLGCHSSTGCSSADELAGKCFNRKLIGAHNTHTDVELFLAGKKLSTNDYIDAAWIYSIKYRKGFPQFACGFCHPMDIGLHKNGQVELDLDPNHALRGSVKTKNKEGGPWVIDRHELNVVVCNNVYCHSSGYVSDATNQYQFQRTPDWYWSDRNNGTSAFAGVDNCAQCHGNSPNTLAVTFENRTSTKEGSSAHARHVVGNHYKDVFDGYSGKLKYAGIAGSGAVHGDPKTSTNFNCNLCHFNTVRDAFNDLGSTCNDCHKPTGGNIPGGLKGLLRVYSSSNAHVNGNVDIAFIQPFTVKSKAQLRDSISSVQSVYTSWTRAKGYKTYSSHDIARSVPSYVGGACSTTACHNATLMEWRTKGPLDCAACHIGLPQ